MSAKRVVQTPARLDVVGTLLPLRRGANDPAMCVDAKSRVWWSTQTPEGVGTVCIEITDAGRSITGSAWGAGAEWLLAQLPDLVGCNDDPAGFEPDHAVVAEAWRKHSTWRVCASGRVFEAAAAAVIEQKVTGLEARHSWRTLLRRFGATAPGPTPRKMFAPPTPIVWAQLPDWEYRKAGMTPQRYRTLRTIAVAGNALERCVGREPKQADALMQHLPGIGQWTSAEVRQRALGDADAVSFGDFHIARNMCWWLTGEVGDDADMAELLKPYAGHRYRVQRLMEMTGAGPPRRGPRFAPPAHRFA